MGGLEYSQTVNECHTYELYVKEHYCIRGLLDKNNPHITWLQNARVYSDAKCKYMEDDSMEAKVQRIASNMIVYKPCRYDSYKMLQMRSPMLANISYQINPTFYLYRVLSNMTILSFDNDYCSHMYSIQLYNTLISANVTIKNRIIVKQTQQNERIHNVAANMPWVVYSSAIFH